MPDSQPAARPSSSLVRRARLSALLLSIETLALVVVAIRAFVTAISAVGADAAVAKLDGALGVTVVVFAVLLGAAVRSVYALGRFGVSYGVTWQIFQIIGGVTLIAGGQVLLGGAAVVLAVLTAAALMATAVGRSQLELP
ncbi:hypothetical protein [Devriesea agamarum]|uniref:hypothetical protein n=1 Tax=Devriesea agamarum TaxID=472569 RepID=UPI00071C56C1|nr:hypothetical protein [Devriesea agamarum]